MAIRLSSGTVLGVEGVPVRVEVDLLRKLPCVVIVGLPGSAVRESTDRIRSAFQSIGADFPRQRVVVNLAPGDLPKSGTAFDLPIALGILASSGQIPSDKLCDTVFVGELGLDGQLCPVRGALPLATMAERIGCRRIVLPSACAAQAADLDGIDIRMADGLAQVVEWLRNGPDLPEPTSPEPSPEPPARDLSEVRGQRMARRALEIAAAGGHNLIMLGSPGCGKTMLASRLPGILPTLSRQEAMDITRIHSVAGLLTPGTGLVRHRPFRAPHHSLGPAGLTGGARLRPGELVLAHHGVLFLDELAEFRPSVLELLRGPLEDRHLVVSRASGTVRFPCSVSLIAAANPCPCGYLGHPSRPCICSESVLVRYQRRLSGPLMDRMDLQVWVQPVPASDLVRSELNESSADVQKRVEGARQRQLHRYSGVHLSCNAELDGAAVREYTQPSVEALEILSRTSSNQPLSARAWSRILKVARTIADLDSSPSVEVEHVAEAASFRVELMGVHPC
jgi:magnesium chelatase family protein